MTNFSLIITAGGTSSRYGGKNKLLEKLDDKTVIEHTLSSFLGFDEINEIIIPANQAISGELNTLFGAESRIKVVQGGNKKKKSVY